MMAEIFAKPGTFKFCAIFCIMMLIWALDDKQEQKGYGLIVACFWIKLARGGVHWLLFIANLTQPSITWKEGTSHQELSRTDWPVGRNVDHCLLVLIYVEVPSPLRMVPSIVRVRKLSIAREQVTRQPSPWFLPQVPSMSPCPDSPQWWLLLEV